MNSSIFRAQGMLDRTVRRIIDPGLDALAGWFAARRITANVITVAGFLAGIAACCAIAVENYAVGLVLILVNRMADGLDGCVARRTASTDVGGFLDIVLDVVFYGGVPFAFAVADSTRLLPACFLIYSFLGTTSSFLAFAAISAKRGVTADADGKKSFFYSVGLMEGTETIVFFVLFCLVPDRFGWLAWIFGGLCWLTVAIRLRTGLVLFQDAGQPVVHDESSSTVPVVMHDVLHRNEGR